MEQFGEINLKRIFDALFSKIAFIVAVVLVIGTISFVYSETMLVPKYASSVSLYVNNESGKTVNKVLGSDIAASQMLVDTYIVMLKSDTVLNQVSNILIENGIKDYDAQKLKGCITASAIDETEVFKVTVTVPDPTYSYIIANVIADVAPKIIQEFVGASSVKVVDYAIEGKQVSPNVQKNTLLGLLIGLILACGIVVVGELFDMRIKTEDELEQWGIPVLGIIPDIDISHTSSNGYYYYYQQGKTKKEKKERVVSQNAGTEKRIDKNGVVSKNKTNSK